VTGLTDDPSPDGGAAPRAREDDSDEAPQPL
jgi:hypothetical protein